MMSLFIQRCFPYHRVSESLDEAVKAHETMPAESISFWHHIPSQRFDSSNNCSCKSESETGVLEKKSNALRDWLRRMSPSEAPGLMREDWYLLYPEYFINRISNEIEALRLEDWEQD